MHEKTKEALESIGASFACTTGKIGRADRFMRKIQENLPSEKSRSELGLKSYYTFENDFGEPTIVLWQASEIAEIGPFMRAVRYAGFRRSSKTEDPAHRNIDWIYAIDDDGEEITARVRIYLEQSSEAKCRYVETGKKEVPVMTLLCGDELEAYENAHEETTT